MSAAVVAQCCHHTSSIPISPKVQTQIKIVYARSPSFQTQSKIMLVDSPSSSLSARRSHSMKTQRWYVPHTINTNSLDRAVEKTDRSNDPAVTTTSEDPKMHVGKGYYQNTFKLMSQMRRHGTLCDVQLNVSDQIITAHKVILAASSPYFNAMFTSDMQEKNKNIVTIHGVDPIAATILVEFAYSGEIDITEDNVQILLPAANILQMFDIQKACCEFLAKQLHPTNCLGIRKFADVHSCPTLLSTANGFALMHFAKVTETEEFLNLTGNEIIQIITSDNINVSSEDEVYRAVINWVRYDISTREPFLSKMLNSVRFPLMTKDSLMDIVANEPLLRTNHELKDLLIEAMTYHLVPEKRSLNQNVRMTERASKNLKPYLFVVGGSSVFSVQDDCECFNPRLNKWIRIAPMLGRRTRAGIAIAAKKLYVIGGYNGTTDVSSVEAYDPVKNLWSTVTPMCTKRSCVGVCSLNGLIYASGGYNGASCVDSVERFDPLSNSWTSIPAMFAKRRYHKMVALNGCLYALGGFDGTNYLSSVEKYDPTLGKWEQVASMSFRRSGPGVAVVHGKIFVAGGIDGGVSLCSTECYDPRRNTWRSTAPLITRRGTHELVEMDGYLYAIGGNDGSSSLCSIERFDPRMDHWKQDVSLKTRRASVAAINFKCDPHIEKFLTSNEKKISDI